jgi:hypothetical protein
VKIYGDSAKKRGRRGESGGVRLRCVLLGRSRGTEKRERGRAERKEREREEFVYPSIFSPSPSLSLNSQLSTLSKGLKSIGIATTV